MAASEMVGAAESAPGGAVPAGAASVAEALGVTPEQAGAVESFGQLVARLAAERLGQALGQPVQVGPALLRHLGPGEAEGEDFGSFTAIDVRWESDGATYAPLLLVSTAELQTILPAERGPADQPNIAELGRISHDLVGHLDTGLAQAVYPPVHLSLPDVGAPTHDEHHEFIRVEHVLSVGNPGSETALHVVHLIPAAALQAIAMAAVPPGDAGASTPGAAAAASPTGTPAFGSQGAGGGVSTMEDTMTTATQPAGTSVHPVQFQPFEGEIEAQSATNLDLLLDVGLRVSVELGRTDLTIKDVLALGPGSVVELDKLAGEPVDILVNNHLIAKGEVVVVDENFGVRVTDIVSPQKRLAKVR